MQPILLDLWDNMEFDYSRHDEIIDNLEFLIDISDGVETWFLDWGV